jgi:WD40 repeat protein
MLFSAVDALRKSTRVDSTASEAPAGASDRPGAPGTLTLARSDSGLVESGASVGLVERIIGLRSSMSARVARSASQQHQRRLRDTPEDTEHDESAAAEEARLDRESRRHGVEPNLLRDLRAAFDCKTPEGHTGVDEQEFVSNVLGSGAPAFAKLTEEATRIWFRTLDKECRGRITWANVSQNLIATAVGGDSLQSGKLYQEIPIEGAPYHFRAHNEPITHMCHFGSVGALFSGSTDGIVRQWDTITMKATERPIHCGNEWITGILNIPNSSRMAVLHLDRSVFLYNVAPPATRAKSLAIGYQEIDIDDPDTLASTEYFRGFAPMGSFVTRELDDKKVIYRQRHQPNLSRVNQGEPPSLVLHRLHGITETPSGVASRSTCFAHLSSGSGGSETFVLGTDQGSIEVLQCRQSDSLLRIQLERTNLHREALTQVAVATALDGFITSSVDGKLKVSSMEINATLQTFAPELNNQVAGRHKPVHNFSYSHSLQNLLVHGCGRHVYVWNALTGARNAVIQDIDHPVMRTALSESLQQIAVLTEHQKVRVYDVRTWRLLDVIEDVQERLGHCFGSVTYLDAEKWLLLGSTEIVAYPMSQAKPSGSTGRVAAGTSMGTVAAGAREPPARCTLSGAKVGLASRTVFLYGPQLVTTYSCDTHAQLSQWHWPTAGDSAITCLCLDETERRLVAGGDNGDILVINASSGHLIVKLKNPDAHVCINTVMQVQTVAGSVSAIFASNQHHLMSWVDRQKANVPPLAISNLLPTDGQAVDLAYVPTHLNPVLLVICFVSGSCALYTSVDLVRLVLVQFPIPRVELFSCEGALRLAYPNVMALMLSTGDVRLVIVEGSNGVTSLIQFLGAALPGGSVTCMVAKEDEGDDHDRDHAPAVEDPSSDAKEESGFENMSPLCEPSSTRQPTATVFVGDSNGYVSVFTFRRLLSWNELAKSVLPALANETTTSRQLAAELVEVRHFWRAHESPLCSVSVLPPAGAGGYHRLVTSAADGTVRTWDAEEFNFIGGFGSPLASVWPPSSSKEKPRRMSALSPLSPLHAAVPVLAVPTRHQWTQYLESNMSPLATSRGATGRLSARAACAFLNSRTPRSGKTPRSLKDVVLQASSTGRSDALLAVVASARPKQLTARKVHATEVNPAALTVAVEEDEFSSMRHEAQSLLLGIPDIVVRPSSCTSSNSHAHDVLPPRAATAFRSSRGTKFSNMTTLSTEPASKRSRVLNLQLTAGSDELSAVGKVGALQKLKTTNDEMLATFKPYLGRLRLEPVKEPESLSPQRLREASAEGRQRRTISAPRR